MRSLSLVIVVLSVAFILYQFTETPHGPDLNIGCEVCHSPQSWALDLNIYSFDHSTTELPLLGNHKELNCRFCHKSLIFSEAPTECSDCHLDMHNNSVGLDCARCHNSFTWLVSNIRDIHEMSRFPLLGSHALASCEDCHFSNSSLIFEPLGLECYDCHNQDYLSAATPNHVASNYSQDCLDCHNIYSYEWGASGFNHTFFPLTLGHTIQDCAECHQTSDYSNADPTCFACHETDYNSSTKPQHSVAGIETNCDLCHSTNPGWSPATFPVHNEYYALNGAHASIANDCYTCHNQDFTNTPTSCIGCHQNDYNQASDPDHIQAQFGEDCESCHSENDWKPATFDHDNEYFPIYSGEHNNEWSTCSECHTVPGNYALFSCIDCHEHEQTEMNNEHSDVNDYTYESNACFDCHPKGSEDDK
jgi:hypothetical protein